MNSVFALGQPIWAIATFGYVNMVLVDACTRSASIDVVDQPPTSS